MKTYAETVKKYKESIFQLEFNHNKKVDEMISEAKNKEAEFINVVLKKDDLLK